MRVEKLITITAGTPINVMTGLNAAQLTTAGYAAATGRVPAGNFNLPKTFINRIFIQMQVGAAAGVGYVYEGISNGRTPVSGTDASVELAAATSTVPGAPYTDTAIPRQTPDIDLSQYWIDGAHSGDTVYVSWDEQD